MSVRAAASRPIQTAAATVLSPGASPWTYTNTSAYLQQVVISGGTITAVTLSQGGLTGLLGGSFVLRPNDAVTVIYAVVPSVANAVNLM